MTNFLFLIGFMGAGKSTLGKLMAKLSSSEFVDTDQEIEKTEKRTIPAIFERFGESYFRRRESEILLSVTENSNTLVVSTGGGVVENQDNIRLMKESGFVLFLDTPIEICLERIKKQKNRPLANKNGNFDPASLVDRHKKRVPLYQLAHTVYVPTGDAQFDAEKMVVLWKNFKQ